MPLLSALSLWPLARTLHIYKPASAWDADALSCRWRRPRRRAAGLRSRRSRLVEQPASVLGQRHALAMTQKQCDPELVLELVDVPAQRGLRDVESLGGLRHAQGVGHSNECFYVPKVHWPGILYQMGIPAH